MFGIRRSNVSYSRNTESIRNTILSENQDNLESIEEQEDIYKNAKFIFYDDKKQFTNQMEIYIYLANYNNKKLLVIIGSDSSIEQLNNQITDSLQSFPEFKGINGVRAEDIYKISNNEQIYLPKEGKASEFINSGDILYCNLITDEYWIKTYFNIQTFNFKKMIKLEYKLKKKMRYKRFKLMLMKGGIELFIENIKSSKAYTTYNYYLKLFEFKIKNRKKVITHNIHNKQKDKTTIDKIINYSSEIIVILKFGIFEKLIHKNIKLSKAYQRNNLRINEYNEISFEELVNDHKFLPEFTAIKELSEEFLTNQYNSKNPKFLFFTKNKPNNTIKNFFYPKNSPYFINNRKSIGEIIEEEKDDKLLNENLNIEEIKSKRDSTLASIKNIETDSNSSSKSININLNEKEENKKIKKKSKSLFSKNKEKELEPIKKKEKKEKIKNMVVVANFLIKEEKKKGKLFLRKISHEVYSNNIELKNKIDSPDQKDKKQSLSKRNISIYDNKSNINHLMEEEEDDIRPSYNFKNDYKMKEKSEEENFTEIEFESKPKTFSDKNMQLNNLLFKSFNKDKSSRNSSYEGLDELFLDVQDNDKENNDNFNLYNDSQSIKIDKSNNNMNPIFYGLYDENKFNKQKYSGDNGDYLNNMNNNNQQLIEKKFERTSTYINKNNNKKSLFSNLRNKNTKANFYQEIKNIFDYDIFLAGIKNLFNNSSDKKIIDKIKMPQSKDIEYLRKEYKFLLQTKKTKQIVELKFTSGECHIYVFMGILFLFSAMIVICLNLDLFSIFY